MDYKLLLDTAVMAGEILLESGAETWRVEDTMLRMLRMSGLKTADVLALTTGFMVTLDDPSMDSMTVMRSVESRATDLNAVNQLSRDFCEGTIDLDTLFHRVRDIYRAKPEIKKNLLAMIATTAGFAIMFGAGFYEILASAIAGFMSGIGVYGGKRAGVQSFLVNCIGAFFLAVTAILCIHYFPGTLNLNVVIIASVMPLVPGVAITNAVYDTLHGDYISGAARMLEAFVTAAAIAIGVGLGMLLLRPLVR